MAITNAQQYQQLVNKPANGKRPGYKGRQDQMGGKPGLSAAETRAADPIGYGGGLTGPSFQGGGDGGSKTVNIPPPKPPKTKDNSGGNNIETLLNFVPGVGAIRNLGRFVRGTKLEKLNNALQRQNYLRSLSPEEQVEALTDLAAIGIGTDNPMGIDRNIERGMGDDGVFGTGIGGGKFITDIDFGGPEAKAVLGEDYTNYQKEQRDRFTPDDKDGPQDPCKGPNPPAYCFTGLRSASAATPEKEDDDEIINYRLMSKGGRAGLAEGGMPYEGGIMDLESARQMYGLGKLVKKITRGVKKIAKSPIGKAALAFGAYKLGGGLLKNDAFKNFMFKNGVPGFSTLTNKGVLAGIGGISALAGLMTPKEEEEESLYAGADIADPRYIMNNPGLFTNRRLAAEGGDIEKEPVAKKTMPLLDMDGQEMDLRAEGGFVPIGRMEKADDVPARLSKNEFVFTADAVRNAGEGDVDKGAEVMYNMMKNLESGGDVSEESQGLEGARDMFQTSQRLEEVL